MVFQISVVFFRLPFSFFPPRRPFRVPFTFASSPLRTWNRLGPKRGNRRIRCEKEKVSLFRELFTLRRLSIQCSQKSSLPRRRFQGSCNFVMRNTSSPKNVCVRGYQRGWSVLKPGMGRIFPQKANKKGIPFLLIMYVTLPQLKAEPMLIHEFSSNLEPPWVRRSRYVQYNTIQ